MKSNKPISPLVYPGLIMSPVRSEESFDKRIMWRNDAIKMNELSIKKLKREEISVLDRLFWNKHLGQMKSYLKEEVEFWSKQKPLLIKSIEV